MSLKLNERYPGRFNNPSAGYPQGSFKNRTTPDAKDGSYLEKDWANDKEGFFQSLLADAGIIANGAVDAVGASQLFDAMKTTVRKASFGIVGSTANLRMTIAAASATGTITADEVVVKSGLAGRAWTIGGFNKLLNLANVGALGMDTGAAPVNGWLAIYAGLNETTGATTVFAQSVGNTVAPAIYGGANAPAGITATALLTVVPTNASGQFKACAVRGRRTTIALSTGYSGNSVGTFTPSLAAFIPANAIAIFGELTMSNTSASSMSMNVFADTTSALGQQNRTAQIPSTADTSNYSNVFLTTPQQVTLTLSSSAGTPFYALYISGWEI